MSAVDFPPEVRKTFAPGGVAGTGTVQQDVPDPGGWYVCAVAFRVVTDATVVTRTPVVSILDGSGIPVAVVAAGYGITASSTADYGFVQGLAEWDQSNNANASGPVPQVPLNPGDSIRITLGAGVAADSISRVRISLAPIALAR